MKERGQVSGVELGGVKIFKMVPWVIGIYEYQLHRLDRELAELCEAYGKVFGPQFFNNGPALMQVVPIENEIRASHEVLPYEKVSAIVENGMSFLVQDCIRKPQEELVTPPNDEID
jgi:hypothetical protein